MAFVLPLVAAGAMSIMAAFPAQAAYTEDTADGRVVDVQIKVRGRSAPLYISRDNWNRFYFQAFEGQNYSIVLRNNTGRRIGVLVSVDGLNVVNGERARLKSNEPMYVHDPWGRAEIKGWRTSLRSVRRFVFVDEHRSYAERTGQANGDMGWIRVLAFKENKRWDWQPRVKYKDRPERPWPHGDEWDEGLDSRERRSAPRPNEPGEAPI